MKKRNDKQAQQITFLRMRLALQEIELADLRALRDEVLDVCAAARAVRCSDCGGAGTIERVGRHGPEVFCYAETCSACEGSGATIP